MSSQNPADTSPRESRRQWLFGYAGLTRVAEVAGILGLAIAIIPLFVGGSHKSIMLQVSPAKKLLIDEQVPSTAQIKVEVGGKVVTEPYLLTGRVLNDGNVPIKSEDLDQMPVTITLPSGLIVTAGTTGASHHAIKKDLVSWNTNTIVLPRVPMNAGDFLEFQALCDGDPGVPHVDCFLFGGGPPTVKLTGTASGPYRVAYFTIPRWTEWCLICLASAFAFLSGIGSVAGFVTEFRGSRGKRLADTPAGQELRAIVSSSASAEPSTVDAVDKLRSRIALTLMAAAHQASHPMAKMGVKSIRDSVAGASARELLVSIEGILSEEPANGLWIRLQRIDGGAYIAVVLLLLVSIVVGLICAGAWRAFLLA